MLQLPAQLVNFFFMCKRYLDKREALARYSLAPFLQLQ
jgi:hypothetical protein